MVKNVKLKINAAISIVASTELVKKEFASVTIATLVTDVKLKTNVVYLT